MKKGWIWVALLLSLGVNIGVFVTIGMSRARPQAPMDHLRQPGDMQPAERLARYLQLQGPERQRFMEIQQRLFQTVRRNREELVALRVELRREVMGEAPEPQKVDRLLSRIGEIHMDLDRAMVESVLATRKLLDPEQQERYFQVLERIERASEWGGRRDAGPAGRPMRHPPPPERP